MKTPYLALTAAGIAAYACSAVQRQAVALARRKAIPKPKRVEIQEWEGEGGAIKGALAVPPTPDAAIELTLPVKRYEPFLW